MAKKTKFSIINNDIHVFRKEWNQVALTTYRYYYYKEISTHEHSYFENKLKLPLRNLTKPQRFLPGKY